MSTDVTTVSDPTPEEIADVLDGAADVLLRDGWCKNVLVNHLTGHRCAVGGVLEAMGAPKMFVCEDSTQRAKPFLVPLAAAVDAAGFTGSPEIEYSAWDTIACWNNRPTTTEDDVHDLLRSTAKGLRERAGQPQ